MNVAVEVRRWNWSERGRVRRGVCCFLLGRGGGGVGGWVSGMRGVGLRRLGGRLGLEGEGGMRWRDGNGRAGVPLHRL